MHKVFGLLLICLTPLAFAARHNGVICNGMYAICASAPCNPIPGHIKKALCQCTVVSGTSFGQTSCNYRKPTKIAYGLTQIISTYSFAVAQNNPVMTCASGTPWANCLDAKCIIDPRAPGKAMCTCSIVTAGKYVTYGGKCSIPTCKNTIWSGATQQSFEKANLLLMKTLNIKKPPYRMCNQ